MPFAGEVCAFCRSRPAVRKCYVCGVNVCDLHVCRYPCKGVRSERDEMFFLHSNDDGNVQYLRTSDMREAQRKRDLRRTRKK